MSEDVSRTVSKVLGMQGLEVVPEEDERGDLTYDVYVGGDTTILATTYNREVAEIIAQVPEMLGVVLDLIDEARFSRGIPRDILQRAQDVASKIEKVGEG